jgi:hypothetical protein
MRVVPFLIAIFAALADPSALEPLGRLDHPAIREASGIVASRRHPGVFWVHNDSGNPPALFAVRRDGSLIQKFAVGVPNVDWEDIATDDHGHLYIGDIGNNGARLPLRAVYRFDEPDPSEPAAGPLRANLVSFYRFAPGERFDAEGLVIDAGQAVLVAKTHDGRDAELFAVPLDRPASLIQPALPKRLGELPGFREPATAADLSSDGKRLVVASLNVARVYERQDSAWRLIGEVRYRADGIEAVCWDGDDLIFAGEGRGVYRIKAAAWRLVRDQTGSATRR